MKNKFLDLIVYTIDSILEMLILIIEALEDNYD